MRVLSFGEILFDIIEDQYYLGGAPLNFAAHLAQFGVESYIFSAVGEDELGRQAINKIEELGVKTSLIQRNDRQPTGTVSVVFNEGQPDYTIRENVAYDFVGFAKDDQTLGETPFDVLYFGSLIQRNETSRETLRLLLGYKPFKEIFYDVNLRKNCYTEEIIRESLEACTILKLNDEEVAVLATMLFGKDLTMEVFAKDIALHFNIKVVVVTAGGQGCYIFEQDKLNFVPGNPVRVIDTVGAGDAFSAAFVFNYYTHGDALKAAILANKLGAFVASSRGPLPDYSPVLRKELGIKNIS